MLYRDLLEWRTWIRLLQFELRKVLPLRILLDRRSAVRPKSRRYEPAGRACRRLR